MNSLCPDPSEFESYQGSRVVLTTEGELSFCGTASKLLIVGERSGLLLETDARHGLCIWCPLDHVKRIRVIPISAEKARPDSTVTASQIC